MTYSFRTQKIAQEAEEADLRRDGYSERFIRQMRTVKAKMFHLRTAAICIAIFLFACQLPDNRPKPLLNVLLAILVLLAFVFRNYPFYTRARTFMRNQRSSPVSSDELEAELHDYVALGSLCALVYSLGGFALAWVGMQINYGQWLAFRQEYDLDALIGPAAPSDLRPVIISVMGVWLIAASALRWFNIVSCSRQIRKHERLAPDLSSDSGEIATVATGQTSLQAEPLPLSESRDSSALKTTAAGSDKNELEALGPIPIVARKRLNSIFVGVGLVLLIFAVVVVSSLRAGKSEDALTSAKPLKVDANNLVGTWYGKGGQHDEYSLKLDITADVRTGPRVNPNNPADQTAIAMVENYSLLGTVEVLGAPRECSYKSIELNGNVYPPNIRMTGQEGIVGTRPDVYGGEWKDTDKFQLSSHLEDTGMIGTLVTASSRAGCPALQIPFHLSLVKATRSSMSADTTLNTTPSSPSAIKTGVADSAVNSVPSVGCSSDGQSGPAEAPKLADHNLPILPDGASRIAYYETEGGVGVVAPRGWHCFGTYGSDSTNLFVSPDPISAQIVFSTQWRGFSGPAVQVSDISGITSGRFEVAKRIAHVFPGHLAYIQEAIAENAEPGFSMRLGPYPADSLRYVSDNVVEYETAANQDGIGTASELRKSENPIDGAAILAANESDYIQLSMRLPTELSDLRPVIVKEFEHDTAQLMNQRK